MAIEIERKFLLANDSWRGAVRRSERLAQGYLGGERCSVRVRIGGAQAHLNIKSRTRGHTRLEFEYPIPLADARQLLAELALPGAIDKTRHHVEHGGRHWEIDEFHGDNLGLIVAEIELEHAEAAFERPSWLGPEVTDDTRYYNASLAERPYADWVANEKYKDNAT